MSMTIAEIAGMYTKAGAKHLHAVTGRDVSVALSVAGDGEVTITSPGRRAVVVAAEPPLRYCCVTHLNETLAELHDVVMVCLAIDGWLIIDSEDWGLDPGPESL